MEKKNLCLFASGNGSNAMKILAYFADSIDIKVNLLLCNNKNAGILEKSKDIVKQVVINNDTAQDGNFIAKILRDNKVDFIALAGYLRKIPSTLIAAYPQHILNIHPALLPKYGGKGMYGMNVHKAVSENNEKESGITIHLVNQNYDEGKIIAQYTTPIMPDDTPEEIAHKVLKIEHLHFASTIEQYIRSFKKDENNG